MTSNTDKRDFAPTPSRDTEIYKITEGDLQRLGLGSFSSVNKWRRASSISPTNPLIKAAHKLETGTIPVAIPTETVYGLAADATRSEAVRNIFRIKNRQQDNPLIVHISSLKQLRSLLCSSSAYNENYESPPRHPQPQLDPETQRKLENFSLKENEKPQVSWQKEPQSAVAGLSNTPTPKAEAQQPQKSERADSVMSSWDLIDEISEDDIIPAIYRPLIQKFWPGPLTMIFPLPERTPLAPEVYHRNTTFGVRMPNDPTTLALVSLAKRPLAAPSANISGYPSPTCADHVKDDLDGKIDIIIDNGHACGIGLESTVVNGLVTPPAILRPGAVSIEELREVPGWENVRVGYKDKYDEKEVDDDIPLAPGMKYRHYSPEARVVLYESGAEMPDVGDFCHAAAAHGHQYPANLTNIGIIRTRNWPENCGLPETEGVFEDRKGRGEVKVDNQTSQPRIIKRIPSPLAMFPDAKTFIVKVPAKSNSGSSHEVQIVDTMIGPEVKSVAQNIFSALRSYDKTGIDVIIVEGVNDFCSRDGIVVGRKRGHLAAAVMNRLRKAATEIIKSPNSKESSPELASDN